MSKLEQIRALGWRRPMIAAGEPESVTKIESVTELRNAVTEIEAAPKCGRRPRGEHPMTPAEKQRLYRERKRAK